MTPTQFSGHCLENWVFEVKLTEKINAAFTKSIAMLNFQVFCQVSQQRTAVLGFFLSVLLVFYNVFADFPICFHKFCIDSFMAFPLAFCKVAPIWLSSSLYLFFDSFMEEVVYMLIACFFFVSKNPKLIIEPDSKRLTHIATI